MRGIAYCCESSERGLALVARSGSHSLFSAILSDFHPDIDKPVNDHPFRVLPNLRDMALEGVAGKTIAVMVRNPVERFRSACARKRVSVEDGLKLLDADVHFWSIHSMGLVGSFAVYFRFPDQIQRCAEWLGVNKAVLRENAEPESHKPVLDEKQHESVQAAYASDIALWESLL